MVEEFLPAGEDLLLAVPNASAKVSYGLRRILQSPQELSAQRRQKVPKSICDDTSAGGRFVQKGEGILPR